MAMLGSGTVLDPYQVATASDLNDVRNNLSAHYIQMNDIDLSGYSDWIPIGDWDNYFSGVYNGNNCNITGLTINANTDSGTGLFGIADYNIGTTAPTLKNINLINVSIFNSDRYTGSLAGYCCAIIVNCHSSGTVESEYDRCGGLVGCVQNYYEDEQDIGLNNCSSSCNVKGIYQYTGGLIGQAIYVNILNCYATGSIIGNGRVGGIIGAASSVVLKNCHATGSVEGASFVGGLIGVSYYGDYTNCYATGNISGIEYSVGGLIGCVEGTTTTTNINQCYAIGTVVCINSLVGGLVGDIDGAIVNILNSYAIGSVESGNGYVGGFIGDIGGDSSIVKLENCYSSGLIVSGGINIGGFIGGIDTTTSTVDIISCYYDSQTSGQTDLYVIPKTTAEMKTQSTFTGWDFGETWGIYETVNDGYPYLRNVNRLALMTQKKYALVVEDTEGSMTYDDKTYKFVKWLEEFPITLHETAGVEATYEYGGNAVTYDEITYSFLASGITDPAATGGYGTYTADTSRTVQSLADRENFVNFYYIVPAVPSVTLSSISNESLLNGFTANCEITSSASPVTMCGIAWGFTPLPSLEYSYVVAIGPHDVGEYVATYQGGTIEPDTTYYVRAFAINDAGVSYSEDASFNIPATLPTVTTGSVESVTENGFVTTINVTDLGTKFVVYGFVWGTEDNPTLATASTVTLGNKTTPGERRVTYQTNIDVDTTYYLAAYATNTEGTAYGNVVEFTLQSNYEWEFIATSDHGALNGLGDDDHPQYHNNTRGDARYYTKAEIDAKRYEPVTNGDIDTPELLFFNGDIIMAEVKVNG